MREDSVNHRCQVQTSKTSDQNQRGYVVRGLSGQKITQHAVGESGTHAKWCQLGDKLTRCKSSAGNIASNQCECVVRDRRGRMRSTPPVMNST